MKNTFLYLFILSLLFNVFQYVNSTKILVSKEEELTKTKDRLSIARDSIHMVQKNDYFDLSNDQDAQDYFFNRDIDSEVVAKKVNEDISELNTNKLGNYLIPYEPIEGKIFIVNKIKILNHRWLIAEFSNGEMWGQILVKYFYNADKLCDFETVETVLYEKQTN